MEQYDDDSAPTKLEGGVREPPSLGGVGEVPPKKPKPKHAEEEDDEEIAEKREQLCILVTSGRISEYTGSKLSLGDVKRLPLKDVRKYHNRYQTTMGARMTNGLMDLFQGIAVEIISRILPIDDKKELNKDLENDKFLRESLTNDIGFVALKGGRYIALADFLFQVVKHVKTEFFGGALGFLEPAEQLVKEYDQDLSNG